MYGVNEKATFLPRRGGQGYAKSASKRLPCGKTESEYNGFILFGSKLYLSPVPELYNGEIIRYAISERTNYRQGSGDTR